MTHTWTIREWEDVPIGPEGVPEGPARRLHALAERTTRRLRTPQPVLARTARPSLRAGQVVGVLSVPGASLEILPKIDREEVGSIRRSVTRMLAVAHGLPITGSEPASLATQRKDLLEVLISLFAERLLVAVRRGLPHRYRQIEDDLRVLRGKLVVHRQLARHAARSGLLACSFDRLSVNTPLNRVFKAAVRRLRLATRSAANERRLDELTARFEFVGQSPEPLRERVNLDRTNAAFHRLYGMARLFLADEWHSATRGGSEGFALLFPMHELFEKFIGQSVKRALGSKCVVLQASDRYALDADPGRVFALQPDILVDSDTVIDTKWKALKPAERTAGVDQADVYQMLAYAQAYKARRLVLIYPWHEGLVRDGIFRNWRVPETSTAFEIATVDIGEPDSVVPLMREIFDVQTTAGTARKHTGMLGRSWGGFTSD